MGQLGFLLEWIRWWWSLSWQGFWERWGFIGDKGNPRIRGYKVVTGDLDVLLGTVTA
jgi:hypothetical protein